MSEHASGTYVDQIRDIFIEARIVPIEMAELPPLGLDTHAIQMLAERRRAGWHAFRLEAPGTDRWITLAQLTDDRVGLQTIGRDGVAVADEAWFAFDAAGVAAIAAALGT